MQTSSHKSQPPKIKPKQEISHKTPTPKIKQNQEILTETRTYYLWKIECTCIRKKKNTNKKKYQGLTYLLSNDEARPLGHCRGMDSETMVR